MNGFVLIITHHPAKFGGHRRCAGEDILLLVCHVTSRDTGYENHVTLRMSYSCHN